MKSLALFAVAASVAFGAAAKLPPLSDEAKAKAADAAARTAHGNKVADYQLCKAMDRIALHYTADAKKAGKEVTPTATPSCADPGAFAPAPVAAPAPKPLEAAGAHSPPATAATPPSTNTPAAAMPKK